MQPITDARLAAALKRLDGRPTAVSLADTSQPDEPLVYVNRAFETMSGYEAADVLGRNCRFLQGPDTDYATVKEIRAAIDTRQDAAFCLLNYHVSGRPFHNLLMLTPIERATGGRYILGCQYVMRPAMFKGSIDNHVKAVQGVAEQLRGEDGMMSEVIWSSMQARAEAIRLVINGYLAAHPSEDLPPILADQQNPRD